jgi:putative peptidoglycan lipid II flippase
MRLTWFVAVPATVLCVVMAEPLVVLLFQRGVFDATSAHETARALMAQGSGIFLVAGVRQLVSAYYALGDTRTPVLVAAIDLCAFVLAAWLLRGPLGHVGVSAGVTVASAVQMLLLWVLLRRHLSELKTREILGSLARTAVAALGAGVLAHLARTPMRAHHLSLAFQAIFGAPLFCATFVVLALALGSPELKMLRPLFSKIARGRARTSR